MAEAAADSASPRTHVMYGSTSVPNLNKFSQFRTGEKYTILGKRKILDKTQNIPAANKYTTRLDLLIDRYPFFFHNANV